MVRQVRAGLRQPAAPAPSPARPGPAPTNGISTRSSSASTARIHYLWRVVDQHGTVLDILVQSRRNVLAAKKFFRKLLKRLQYVPRVIVTDKLPSYGARRLDWCVGGPAGQSPGGGLAPPAHRCLSVATASASPASPCSIGPARVPTGRHRRHPRERCSAPWPSAYLRHRTGQADLSASMS